MNLKKYINKPKFLNKKTKDENKRPSFFVSPKFKRSLKVTKWLTMVTLISGIFVGVGFGLSNYATFDGSYKKSNNFSNTFNIQANIEYTSGSQTPVSEIINNLDQRIDYSGYLSGQVYQIGSNTISIDVAFQHLNDLPVFSGSNIVPPSNTTSQNLFSYQSTQSMNEEMLLMYYTLFYKTNVTFRNVDGTSYFTTANGNVTFNSNAVLVPTSGSGSGGSPSGYSTYNNTTYAVNNTNTNNSSSNPNNGTTTPPTNSIDPLFPPSAPNPQLIKQNSATVGYDSGNPYISFVPANNQIKNQMITGANALYQNGATSTGTGNQYVVWMGYNTLENIVNEVDPTGLSNAGSLYSYCYISPTTGNTTTTPIDMCKPFLITTGKVQQQISPYASSFKLQGTYTPTQANFIKNKINYSTDNYTFVLNSVNNLGPNQSPLFLAIFILLFIIAIGFAMFTFAWYFGLLGLITAGVMSLFLLSTFGFISLFAIPLTIPLLISVFIIFILFIYVSWNLLSTFKKELINSKESIRKRFFASYKHSLSSIFVPSLILLITIATISVVSLIWAALPIYLALLMFLFNTVAILLFMPFVIWSFTHMFDLEEIVKKEERWSLIYGYKHLNFIKSNNNKKIHQNMNLHSNAKTVKIFSFASLLLIVLSLGVFGILYITTGNGFNTDGNYNQQYQYQITQTYYTNTNYDVPGATTSDPYNQQANIDAVKSSENQIIDILNSNGINVTSSSIIRNNVYQYVANVPAGQNTYPSFDPSNFTYYMGYGLLVNSNDQMTYTEYTNINSDLSSISVANPNNPGQDMSFALIPTYSLTNISPSTNSQIVSNALAFNTVSSFLIAISIIILLVGIFLILYNKYSGFFAFVFGFIMELGFLFALMTLLHIPFNPIFWIGLFAVIVMSVITKSIYMSRIATEMHKIKKTNEKTIKEIIYGETSSHFITTIGLILAIVFVLFLATCVFGSSIVTAFFISVAGGMIILLYNYFIFPYVYTRLEITRLKRKQDKIRKDIINSKDKDFISEEYIEGINY